MKLGIIWRTVRRDSALLCPIGVMVVNVCLLIEDGGTDRRER